MWERRKVEMPASKPEPAQEKRVADAALNLTGRSTAMSGTGTGAGKKWSGAISTAAIGQMFFRPNLLILPEAVYDVLEYRPRLLDKPGEANLAKLFRINKVVIAKGRADFSAADLRDACPTRGASGAGRGAVRRHRGGKRD
jgi:hypothetical protein